MEREHARHRVAGEPEEVRGADAPDGDRAARLHGHLPEIDSTDVLKDGFDEVVVADGDAARREHDVRGPEFGFTTSSVVASTKRLRGSCGANRNTSERYLNSELGGLQIETRASVRPRPTARRSRW
jgi:hypothetical protein